MKTYHNRAWRSKRKQILKRDNFLDKELLRYGRRIEADTVHHIYPLEFYPELALVDWNLISLSKENHNAMHNRSDHNLSPRGVALQKRFKRKYKKWCEEKNFEPHFEN